MHPPPLVRTVESFSSVSFSLCFSEDYCTAISTRAQTFTSIWPGPQPLHSQPPPLLWPPHHADRQPHPSHRHAHQQTDSIPGNDYPKRPDTIRRGPPALTCPNPSRPQHSSVITPLMPRRTSLPDTVENSAEGARAQTLTQPQLIPSAIASQPTPNLS